MKKLFNEMKYICFLILKDIIFNVNSFVISIGFAIIAYTAIAFDSDQNIALAIYLSFMVIFTNWIGKSCLIEEKDSVYDYLKILPLKKSNIVLAKYIASLSIIFVSYITFLISKILVFILKLNTLDTTSELVIIIIISMYVLYAGLYLYIFFKYTYASAQNTILILFILMFIIFKYFKGITYLNISNMNAIAYITLGVSLTILFISYKFAVKGFENSSAKIQIKFFKKFRKA